MTSGCIEENNEDNNIQDYENLILGSWTGIETVNNEYGNFTSIIDYTFYSNNSVFSGITNMGEYSYNETGWGSYTIDDENIEFIDSGGKYNCTYSINSEENSLTLSFADGYYIELIRNI